MTYETVDTSVDGGAPEEFYIFTVENLVFRYTDAPKDTMFNGKKYLSRQIGRTALVNNMSIIDNSDTKITLPRADALSAKCAGLFTPTIINVEIFQRHRTDPDAEARRVFYGYLLEIDTSGRETGFAFTSLMRAYVEASVVTVAYTTVCNHEWADSRCRVNAELYKKTSQVMVIDLWTLTLADFVGVDMSKYIGGYIINERTGVRRNNVNMVDNYVFVDGMFADIEIGDRVNLYPGCDHDVEGDCFKTYDNVANFGGYPFVPRANPFRGSFGEIDYVFQETPS